jgi:hypothetical protein
MIPNPNGVRVGMRVRDLDGRKLGRVTRLYEESFAFEKGFPLLFRQDFVGLYDEVASIQGDELTLARTADMLQELAAGRIPRAWRTVEGPGALRAATPSEARRLAPPAPRRAA